MVITVKRFRYVFLMLSLFSGTAFGAEQPGAGAPAINRPVQSSASEAASSAAVIEGIKKQIEAARSSAGAGLPALVPASGGAAAAPQGQEGPGQKKEKKNKLDISGFRYLKYRQFSSTGNSDSFLSRSGLLTYGRRVEQGSNLQFSAKQGKTEFSGTINEMPLQERDMQFKLNSGQYKSKFGDFTTEFGGGSLASLNKKITGVEIGYESKKTEFDFISSQAKSESRTISFNGNNTHGPYDMNTFEILPGSVQVRLNGQLMPANKYDVDYFAGQINFCSNESPPDCTNIKTSDSIQITYEQKLLLSLTGGNIQGFSAGYKFDKGGIKGALLEQQANRSTQRIRQTKAETFTGAGQLALPDPLALQLTPTSDKFQYQGRGLVFMVRNSEIVSRNGVPLQRDRDYTFAYDGAGAGRISLSTVPSASDTFNVAYSYYVQEFINLSLEEDILDTGVGTNVFYLSKFTVYPGLEIVQYCQGANEHCDTQQTLVAGPDKDYTIDVSNNAIVMHSTKAPNAQINTFLRVTYYYVPTEAPGASAYNHTVRSILGGYDFGDKLKLGFELASSLSDVSKTSVQVMGEVVAAATSTITCPTVAVPPVECERTLAHGSIEENSDAIRFNTRSIMLTRGADYQLDTVTGHILFMGGLVIPAGTVVYADYRYMPNVSLGLSAGKALRLNGSTKFRNVNLDFSSQTTDPFFSPISGNNTLETNRFDYNISIPFTKNLSLQSTRSKYSVAQDIFNIFSTKNTDDATTLAYTSDKLFKKVGWTFGKTAAGDNRNPQYIDTNRKQNAFDLEMNLPFAKNATFALRSATEKFNDLTMRTDNTSSSKSSWEFGYRPSPILTLNILAGTEKVNSSGVSEPFGTNTQNRNIMLTYQPAPIVTILANIDSQKIGDSRPDSGLGSSVNTSTIRLTTLPFWKIRSFSYSLTQQDRPSQFTGGSKNAVNNVTFTLAASKSVAVTPAYTISKTGTDNSSSKTNLKGLKIEYLPPGKKIEAVATRDQSNTSSNSTGSPSSTSSTKSFSWDMKYKFTKATNLIYRFTRNNNTQSGSALGSGDKRNLFQFTHKVGEKWNLTTQYSLYDTFAEATSKERKLELVTDYKISKFLTWNLDYSRTKYADGMQAKNGYNGNLLETQLMLKF